MRPVTCASYAFMSKHRSDDVFPGALYVSLDSAFSTGDRSLVYTTPSRMYSRKLVPSTLWGVTTSPSVGWVDCSSRTVRVLPMYPMLVE